MKFLQSAAGPSRGFMGSPQDRAIEAAVKPRAQRARRGRSHAQAAGRAWRAGLTGAGHGPQRSMKLLGGLRTRNQAQEVAGNSRRRVVKTLTCRLRLRRTATLEGSRGAGRTSVQFRPQAPSLSVTDKRGQQANHPFPVSFQLLVGGAGAQSCNHGE